MAQLFDMFFGMGLEACLVIAAVCAVRLVFRRLPRRYSYMLWAVVLFRLLCPVSFQSAFSLFSLTGEPVRIVQDGFGTASVIPEDGTAVTNLQPSAGAETAGDSVSIRDILALIWILGMIALAGYNAARWIILKQKMRLYGTCQVFTDSGYLSRALPKNLSHVQVWESDCLETAFAAGVLRPRIYLPAGLDTKMRQYILAHECIHLRRRDPVWRMLGLAALCLHWYHPLVWAAWFLSSKDMEMSCDEAVVQNFSPYAKKEYSQALLSMAGGWRTLPGKMPAFGEGETGSRIRNVLHYKKPAFLLTAAATAGIIGLGVFLAADPPGAADVQAVSRKVQKTTHTKKISKAAEQDKGSKAQNSVKAQSDKSQNDSAETAQTHPSGYAVWQADLTHDGRPETIRLDVKTLQQTGLAEFMVLSSDGGSEVLFSKPICTSHTAWTTFALYDGEDGEYLFEYIPYFGQGSGAYSFRVFSLSDSGEILVKEAGAVNFAAGMPYGAPDNDVDALIRFTDTVNAYWSRSALLATTDQFTVLPNLYDADGSVIAVGEDVNYYVSQNALDSPLHYIERMGWTDIVLEGTKSAGAAGLRTRLEAVNRVMAEQRESVKQNAVPYD